MRATRDQIKRFFERLGFGISKGDFGGVSRAWVFPALVLSDQETIAVSDAAQVEQFFGKASKWYRSRGLVATRPELERIDVLSERLVAVDVRWPAFDKTGAEKASERSHYILRLSEDGRPGICAALTRTESPMRSQRDSALQAQPPSTL